MNSPFEKWYIPVGFLRGGFVLERDSELRMTAVADDTLSEPMGTLLSALQRRDADALVELFNRTGPHDFDDTRAGLACEVLQATPYDLAAGIPALHALRARSLAFAFSARREEIGPQLYEAVLQLLDEDKVEWAAEFSRFWALWMVYVLDVEQGLSLGNRLLEQHPGLGSQFPSVIAAVAMLASLKGDRPLAGRLWQLALHHPNADASADEYWRVRIEWSRSDLMGAGADYRTAITNLRRGRDHFAGRPGAGCFDQFFSASFHLVYLLLVGGSPQEAREVIHCDQPACQPLSEHRAHYVAADVLASALLEEWDTVEVGLGDDFGGMGQATLPLAFLLPAQMHLAASTRNLKQLLECIVEATQIETATQPLAHERVIWRLHAASMLRQTGREPMAAWLLKEALDISVSENLPIFEAMVWLNMFAGTHAAWPIPDMTIDGAARRLLELVDTHGMTHALTSGRLNSSGAVALWVAVRMGHGDWQQLRQMLLTLPAEVILSGADVALGLYATGDSEAARMMGELGLDADQATMTNVPLAVRTFGGLRLFVYGSELPSAVWRGRGPALQILSRLLYPADSTCRRDDLSEYVYGDVDPKRISGLIAPNIHQIRQVLAGLPDAETANRTLTTSNSAYTLSLDPTDTVDVHAFVDAAATCLEASGDRSALVHGRRAIDLYRGEFLAGVQADTWLEAAREHLRDTWISVVERLLDLPLEPTDVAACVVSLEPAVAQYPIWERGCRTLMRLHALTGEIGEASIVFNRTRRALQDQLGITPSHGLILLHSDLISREEPTHA